LSALSLDPLSGAEKDALHQRVLHILHSVGVGVRSEKVLGVLEEGGAHVDWESRIAKLPPELVEDCIARTPRSVLLAARDPARDLRVGGGAPLACATDGEATMVLDDDTGVVRTAVRDDLLHFYRLFDALPELDFVWTSIMASDLDPVLCGLENDLTALECTSKHVQSVVAHSSAEIPPLLEMLETIAGASLLERPIYSSLHCPVSPLQFEGDKLDASVELAKHGVPILLYPLPLLGTTAPMSLLGTAAVTIAEFLAGIVIFQLAAPGCPLLVIATGGVGDLRTGNYLCGTPEVALLSTIGVSMSRRYGLPCVCSGISSDAKSVGFQAGAEGMMTAMAAVLAGTDALVAAGLIDGARVASTAKLILDCDSLGALRRLLKFPPVDDASMLIGDIEAVGPGGHFLTRRSSRERARAGEVWRPSVFQRGNIADFAGRPLIDDALERARTLLAAHAPTPVPDDLLRDARVILTRYADKSGGIIRPR
jgi:trimethylamine---corrinoid protein Co-methyltransferase